MEKYLKARIRFTKQIYPKTKLNNGDWGCLEAIVEELDKESDIKESGFIKVIGTLPQINLDLTYKIIAVKVKNNYGVSYDIVFICSDMNLNDIKEQEIFLKAILTTKQFNEFIKVYPSPVEILERGEIELLTRVKGISTITAIKILNKYENNKDYSRIYIELKDVGLTKKMIDKLVDTYKSSDVVVEKIKENPYI